jgi:XTP/dITP diphosphohydrolase
MKICFATNNPNKVQEIQQLLGKDFEILSLQEIGCAEELAETQDTLEGNSAQKARYVFDHYGVNCFADDTGLEVEALDNAPGVYSARYAGPQRSSDDNMKKLLSALQGQEHRSARFRTVITLLMDGTMHQFEGVVEGQIVDQPTGDEGFGYDPLFMPEGYDRTFAQMNMQEKNKISHRGRAIRKLVDFLRK